jgi:hypothetical protein
MATLTIGRDEATTAKQAPKKSSRKPRGPQLRWGDNIAPVTLAELREEVSHGVEIELEPVRPAVRSLLEMRADQFQDCGFVPGLRWDNVEPVTAAELPESLAHAATALDPEETWTVAKGGAA